MSLLETLNNAELRTSLALKQIDDLSQGEHTHDHPREILQEIAKHITENLDDLKRAASSGARAMSGRLTIQHFKEEVERAELAQREAEQARVDAAVAELTQKITTEVLVPLAMAVAMRPRRRRSLGQRIGRWFDGY